MLTNLSPEKRLLADEMAAVLNTSNVDLNDRSGASLALVNRRFRASDVSDCLDEAIEIAGQRSCPMLPFVRDAAAAAFALAVWLGWYVVLCPAGGV